MHVNELVDATQRTSYVFIATPEVRLPKTFELTETEGILPAEYPLASLVPGAYEFEHKITLLPNPTNGGFDLQILSKGPDGQINMALPENRFPLVRRFVRIELVDTHGNQSEYTLRLSAGQLRTVTNRTVLPADDFPSIDIALTRFESETLIGSELNIIGTIDVRARQGRQVRVVITAGEPVEIGSDAGHVIIQS